MAEKTGLLNLPIVAVVTTFPLDLVSFTGGVETATAAMLDGLVPYQDRFEFHILSPLNTLQEESVKHHNGFTFHFFSVSSSFRLLPRFFFRIYKTLKILKEINPSIVHSQGHVSLSLAPIVGGYTRIHTIHGISSADVKVWGKRKDKWATRVDAFFQRIVIKYHRYIISISPYITSMLSGDKIVFQIPNAVRQSFFDVTHSSQVIESPFVLFSGALTPLKRPRDILEAVRFIQDAGIHLKVVFCGPEWDKTYAEELKSEANELEPDSVVFPGNIPHNRLMTYMSQALALVVSSAQENSPMSIAEAMVSRCCTVATRIGGIPYMIEDGKTGFLYNVGDVKELARILTTLLTDTNLHTAVIDSAHKTAVSNYSPESIGKATINAYDSILGISPY